jgi:uncharacterized protein (TIGR03083 family)
VTRAEDVKKIGRGEGLLLSRIQYARLVELLASLSDDDWASPTDCEGWTVKDIGAHVLGSLEAVRRPREFVRQALAGLRVAKAEHLREPLDGINAVQVREHAGMTGAQVAQAIAAIAEPALRHRARTPWLLRQGVRVKLGVSGRTSLAWILDVVYSRDTFVHRIDVSRATGRDVHTDDVERRIVAEIVREWAARHGEPVTLTLTGPAGGTYECNGGGPEITEDAVEFTRLVSGRGTATGLLAVPAQF